MKQASVKEVKDRYKKATPPTLDGNIQDPIARRPSGKRAKVRYGLCGHGYAVFNLDLRFPGAATETSSHFVRGPWRVSHRPFQLPLAYRLEIRACANSLRQPFDVDGDPPGSYDFFGGG
jgi:hypothetical protein